MEQLEKAAFSGIQNRNPLGQTNLWLILRQLSNHLYFCPVTSPSPLPKLHYDKTIQSVSLPLSKEPDAPARGCLLWVLHMNSELFSRKDRCTNPQMKHRGKQKGKVYIFSPYLPTTWTREVEKNSALTILSIYFCYLHTF